jgi:hypothetical protein
MAVNFGTGGPKQAAGTNTAGSSEREDLANFISMITRDETPFLSSIGKTKSNAILHEWQTDELTPPTLNAQYEGVGFNDVSGSEPAGLYRTRLGNYCQISSKTVSVSGTKRAVDQAGVADEYAYQLKKRGTELRRDVEFSLVHTNQSSTQGGIVNPNTAGSITLPTYPAQFSQTPVRQFGGYQAFINFATDAAQANSNGGTLYIKGPTLVVGPNGQAPVVGAGANGVATTQLAITASGTTPTSANDVLYIAPGTTNGTGSVFAGTGTAGQVGNGAANTPSTQSLQLTAVDNLMQNIYQNGGKATKIMLSPANRKAFSARAQGAGASSSTIVTSLQNTANVRRNVDETGSLRQSVEVYMSDFGDIMVVPNYVMGLTSNVTNGGSTTNIADFFGLVYDPMWFQYASLRPLHEVDLGQLGDSIIGQIVEEGSLEVRNPKGCGMIVGMNGQ